MDTGSRRTQKERTDASRQALLTAAHHLFGSLGYAGVGTERVAREAGLTRGPLYHQFADKTELFAAVLEEVEAQIAVAMVASVGDVDDPSDTAGMLIAGANAFLDACADPHIQRIVLIDGPSVLGWERWREICLRHSVGRVAELLADGMRQGTLAPAPIGPLTHVLVGAIDEAALYISRSEDPELAREEINEVLRRLGLALTAAPAIATD